MTPADIARNDRAVRNMAARLESWGLDDAHKRAEFLLVNAYADGWKPVEKPPPPVGNSSTKAGRARARELFEETRRNALQTGDSNGH